MRRPWLLPLSPLYRAASLLRWARYTPQRLEWPVVSIGNLSTGGTGKTPFTIALADLLRGEGVSVDVLSRGYGRSGTLTERVDPGGDASRYGDEPLLIARASAIPVYVGARRLAAGRLAESESGSGNLPHLHLLDDGFQHRQLHRDADIVLVNSEDLADHLLPAGNLREPRSELSRATILAVAEEDQPSLLGLRAEGFTQAAWIFRCEMSIPAAISGPVVAFCGIARPGRFFTGLERAGLTLASRRAFPDHHLFTARDLEALKSLARKHSAVLVTTEKDAVRLESVDAVEAGRRRGAPSAPILSVGLRLVFQDQQEVKDWLMAFIAAQAVKFPV